MAAVLLGGGQALPMQPEMRVERSPAQAGRSGRRSGGQSRAAGPL